MNRVSSLAMSFGSDPTQNMSLLLGALSPSTIVPRPDKYYTFIYKAKTRGIRYDQHPLIQCGSVLNWGFTGENVHIGSRRYTWNEVLSNIYEVSQEEFETLRNVPLARYLIS